MPASCCDSKTCTLTVGSVCASGPCCTGCQHAQKGKECRSASGEGDLPEYYNGSSASCPANLFVQDGHPCGEVQWLCVSSTTQCQDTFGEGSTFGPPECYNQINTETDEAGDCGSSASEYTKCKPKDLKCGKLICEYTIEPIINIPNASVTYINVSGHRCVALEFPCNDKDSTKMWVRDGTVCDSNKACRNKECVDVGFLGYDYTAEKCNSHGVCNNKKHCHCNPTYLPPNCQHAQDAWPGGSIDNLPNLSFLLIPFLGVLTFILLKVYCEWKNRRTEEEDTSDEQLGSESESKV